MQVHLDEEEQQALLEILEEVLHNLSEEIYKTENFDYREQLKRRQAVVKSLLERLRPTVRT
ncbi:MAG: hypothetical protein K6U02_04780 [Firmicutes bacterium]|nr:hypothetical protein [Bacillota bacterium]